MNRNNVLRNSNEVIYLVFLKLFLNVQKHMM